MAVLQLLDEWAQILSEFAEPNPPLQQDGVLYTRRPGALYAIGSDSQREGYDQGKAIVKQWGQA